MILNRVYLRFKLKCFGFFVLSQVFVFRVTVLVLVVWT